jgi:hypothetical protein
MQLRLSIPFVGGVTAVYTETEVTALKLKLNNKWNIFKTGVHACTVAFMEGYLRAAANSLQAGADKCQEHAYKYADRHEVYAKQLKEV